MKIFFLQISILIFFFITYLNGQTTLVDENVQDHNSSQSVSSDDFPDTAGFCWHLQHPSPFYYNLTGVFFLNHLDGWAIGDEKNIIHTIDGGKNWKLQNIPTSNPKLNAIFFVDFQNGTAVGNNGVILSTNDGGNTWTQNNSGVSNNIFAISQIDSLTKWVVGSSNCVLKSIDGGANWNSITVNPSENHAFGSVFFKTKDIGFLTTYGAIYKTTNGGDTWVKPSFPSSNTRFFQNIHFVNDSVGWMCFNSNYIQYTESGIFKTKDGGDTWQHVYTAPYLLMLDIQFFDELTGYILKPGGVSKTIDGALTWANVTNIETGFTRLDFLKWSSFSFPDSLFGCIVGRLGVLSITADACNTWTPLHNELCSDTEKLYFKNEKHGWCLGEHGKILKTQNGGVTWESTNSGLTQKISNVYFKDSLQGIATGVVYETAIGSISEKSMIFLTEDGGLHWRRSNFSFSTSLTKLFMLNDNEGWAVGYFTNVYHTSDGGVSWEKQGNSNMTGNDVFFIDSLHGWICANNGVYRTSDGGNNWNYINISSTVSLNCLAFKNTQQGWLFGKDGLAKKTVNGGDSWLDIQIPVTSNITSMYLGENDHIWISTDAGKILYSSNAGVSWSIQFNNANVQFTKLQFNGNDNGWAVGAKGIILKTTNAGLNWETMNTSGIYTLLSIFPLANNHVWAGGEASPNTPILLKYNESSNNWDLLAQGTYASLNNITFYDIQNGWATGSFNTVLKTNDGGENWYPVDLGLFSNDIINCIFVKDSLNIFIGSENGNILKSSDGGLQWVQINTGSIDFISKIVFPSSQLGWAISKTYYAGHPNIFKSIDGGNTWQINPEIPSILNDIIMIDSLNGWLSGSGNPFKTIDGGEHWIQQSNSLALNNGSNKIFFLDTQNGWIIETGSVIYSTNNGGVTWEKNDFNFNFFDLTDVFAINTENIWVCGAKNKIIKLGRPDKPIVKDILVCKSDSTIILSAIGSNLTWYQDSIGGFGNKTQPTIVINETGVFNWYVSQSPFTIGDCMESELAHIQVVIADQGFVCTGQSDLKLSNLQIANPVVYPNDVVNVHFNLQNIGNLGITDDFTITCFLSSDNSWSINDLLVSAININDAPIGLNAPFETNFSIPASLQVGNYFLILKVDSDNTIPESNENNNTLIWLNKIILKSDTILSNNIPISPKIDFVLTPNPATNYFTIELKGLESILENIAQPQGKIINQLGQIVQHFTFEKLKNNMLTLDLHEYANGIYFIKIETAGQRTVVKKLVVAHE
jgi:photosystem II stability/assembly factor-like uncharacterized protein